MLSAKEQREARRRRILERGADRLAYISGQVKTLTREEHNLRQPPEAKLVAVDAEIPPASVRQFADGWRELQQPQPGEPPSSTGGLDAVLASRLLRDVQSRMQALDLGVTDEQQAPSTPNQSSELLPSAARIGAAKLQEEAVGSKSRKASAFGSRKGWNQCISFTEIPRAILAVILALLVVAQALMPCDHPSHQFTGLSFPGWPLYLILFTDFTLALGVLFTRPANASHLAEEEPVDRAGQDDFSRTLNKFSRLGDHIESGMALFQALQAVVLDCTIYVVSLVSAFSVVQYLHLPLCSTLPNA